MFRTFGELGNFRLGQEALDLAHRCFPDAPRRVVGAQAALDGEREDRADKRDALRGDALAARGHAAGPSLLERQPAAKRQYRSIALANGIIVLGQPLRYRSLFVAGLRLDPGDGILPCTTVTELIDCVTSTAVPLSAAICARVAPACRPGLLN